MSEINQLHDNAMRLAQEAFLAQRKGNLTEMVKFSKKAFELERKAALAIPMDHPDAEPSRSILFKSAAFLAFDAHLESECIEMIAYALSNKPDISIKMEMDELTQSIIQRRIEVQQQSAAQRINLFSELYKNHPTPNIERFHNNAIQHKRLLTV